MNIKEKLIYALENGQMVEFLEGKNHLDICNNSHFANASTPTDYIRLIKEGIYELYNSGNSNITFEEECALEKMIQDDIFGIYCALDIIYIQLKFEYKNQAPFKINIEKLIPIIKSNIIEKKDELKKYYEWAGQIEKEGMYGYFLRLNDSFLKNNGFSIID